MCACVSLVGTRACVIVGGPLKPVSMIVDFPEEIWLQSLILSSVFLLDLSVI